VDAHGTQSTLVYSCDTGVIYDCGSPSGKNINEITKECLNATGHDATYREIIAKAVAEPMEQRCKFALELHFRTWCHNHRIKYPISDDRLNRMYGLRKKDFYNEFSRIIKANKIAYPLQDAQQLINVGKDKSGDVPLEICAKARNVSVSQIIDTLFSEN
jgi:hypothetical protein